MKSIRIHYTSATELNRRIDALGVSDTYKPGIRDLVAEITGIDLKPEPTYSIGQKFTYFGGTQPRHYILARTDREPSRKVAAINLETGCPRRLPALSVGDLHAITRSELCWLFKTDYSRKIILEYK